MEVIILTPEFHNGLSIIESLGQKGVYTNVIDVTEEKKPYLLCSKYVKKGWKCKSFEDAIAILENEFENNSEKAMVISCSDEATVVLDRHYESLKDRYFLPLTSLHGRQEEFMSKQFMTNLAFEVGIDVPQTWVYSLGSQLPGDIVYPCMTKAISSVAGSKNDNRICQNQQELELLVKDSGHASTLVIQQFIEKEYEFQFLGCSFKDGEEILISGRTHLVRPNGIENVYFLKFDKIESELKPLEDKVREFIRRTKYNGPFSVEFLHDKKGKNYFMEMNFRNDGNAYCQTFSGMNIPYIMYLFYSEGDYKKEINNSEVHEIYMMPEVEYLEFKLKGEFGWKEWYRNMRKANCYNTYFKEDKAPFFQMIKNRMSGYLRRRFGK